MRHAAEGHEALRAARELEALRLRVLRRVASRGAHAEEHPGVRRNLHLADARAGLGVAWQQGHRPEEAHGLLDRGRNQGRVGAQARLQRGIAQHRVHHAAEREVGGVRAGREQQLHEPEDVLIAQAMPLDLGHREARDEVRTRHGAPRLDEWQQESVHLRARP